MEELVDQKIDVIDCLELPLLGSSYTERNSKIGILTRRLLKISCLERATIASGKARMKTKILMQCRRG